MISRKTRSRIFNTFSFTALVLVVLLLTNASHVEAGSNAWFNGDATINYSRPEWMGELDDNLLISQLSIPGTHDTMSLYGGGPVECQSMSLSEQLNCGIRVLDIRCRHFEDTFEIHHGAYYQHANFGDVLEACKQFLADHPSETILMRVKQTHDEPDCTRSFAETFEWYMDMVDYQDLFWQSDDYTQIPPLGDVRGKIVLLQDFPSSTPFGLSWDDLNIQDEYIVYWMHGWCCGAVHTMDCKWGDIKDKLYDARDGGTNTMFINFTSGSTWMNPVDVARGIVTPDCYCIISVICIPFFYTTLRNTDGMNERTYRQLLYALGEGEHWRIGSIMMDFPGAGLIDLIIAHNGLPTLTVNNPPVADANGPYYVNEGGGIITFDGSASSDYEDDQDDNKMLSFRWDFDGNLDWDTDWSESPIAQYEYIYGDNFDNSLTVRMEVKDSDGMTDDYWIAVIVDNVAPTTKIESVTNLAEGCVLPGQEVVLKGSFTDPGIGDTHTATIDWGDRSNSSIESVDIDKTEGSDSGYVTGYHKYSTYGQYTITLIITDDDDGIGFDRYRFFQVNQCCTDSHCNDGLFCSGVEACVLGMCRRFNPPCPDDGQFCNGEEICVEENDSCLSSGDPCDPDLMCDEESDSCVGCLEDGDCDDGLFCNGEESCADTICQSGAVPCPDDGLFCNGVESCDEENNMCLQSGNPCSEPTPVCDEENDVCTAGEAPLPTILLQPDFCYQSRWFPLPMFMKIEGSGTHFDSSSTVTFNPESALMALPFVVDEENILIIGLHMPSWLTGPLSSLDVTVTTGAEEAYESLSVEPLVLMLDEEREVIEMTTP